MATFRHRNGGGRLVGIEAMVGSDCFVDRHSLVEGKSEISFGSQVVKSAIKNSTIVHASIQNTPVLSSHVAEALVGQSALDNVIVRGTKFEQAVVQNCVLSGEVVVEGCTLRNAIIDAPILIHKGVWHRAPRYYVLRDTPLPFAVALSECTDDRFHVGCECRPFAEWDQKEELLRKIFVHKQQWNEETFNSIRRTFEAWRSTPYTALPISQRTPVVALRA